MAVVLRLNYYTKQSNFMTSVKKFSYLGSVNSSSKIAKTDKVLDIDTYVMYLAPASLSGFNVCPMATKECIAGCLNTSGRAKMETENHTPITSARIAKTKFLFSDRKLFNKQLFNEVKNAKNRTAKKDKKFAVRLNGTSDLTPEIFKNDNGENILQAFPDVQFYDYTKVLRRVELAAKYPNYDLTFSYTGYNWADCEIALQNNVRVAVIFNLKKGEPLPETFNGVPVIDGDAYDYRPEDGKNVIVGLRWKVIKDKKVNDEIKNSPFAVQKGCAK